MMVPEITSNAILTGYTLPGLNLNGQTYSYQINALDVDNENLTYTLQSYPDGMTISSSGLITWAPSQGIYTSDIVEVKVSDGELFDIQSFSISVVQVDCNGDADGTASVDECGVCSGGLSGHIANSDKDCAGECFGLAVLDECGVCNGGNADKDCAGECFGLAALDECGVCSGGTSDHVANSDKDCNGDCFGEAILDDCGECSGGNSTHIANIDKDCNGDCFGVAELDDCGVCSGGLSGRDANVDVDCAGNCLDTTPGWDGQPNAEYDECGVCNGGNADKDCAGECFGLAALDECGVCSGGTSDHVANSDKDCNGMFW